MTLLPPSKKTFSPLYTSDSANNAEFLTVGLKAENIFVPFKESKRLHNMGDLKALKSTMQGLIKDKVSLHDVVAEREAGKAKVRAENERKLKVIRAKIQLKPPQSNPHNNFTLHKAFL